jgi:hypothetical protein
LTTPLGSSVLRPSLLGSRIEKAPQRRALRRSRHSDPFFGTIFGFMTGDDPC